MIEDPSKIAPSPLPLEGLRVCISGAVPEREHWGGVADLERLILMFVGQMTALVVRYGGQVVHGSQPLLTPVVAEQARRQSREDVPPLTLFASQLFGDIPEVTLNAARLAGASMVLTPKVGSGDVHDRETRNMSSTAMRLAMTQDIDVLIAVGGKLHHETGFSPGVLEELAQARWHAIPCFVVGAYGGAVGQLEEEVLREISGDNQLGPESGLNIRDLARWEPNMDEYVGMLLAHLARQCQHFRRAEPAPRRIGSFTVSPVNQATVEDWSSRFASLLDAIQTSNTVRARQLLRTPLP